VICRNKDNISWYHSQNLETLFVHHPKNHRTESYFIFLLWPGNDSYQELYLLVGDNFKFVGNGSKFILLELVKNVNSL